MKKTKIHLYILVCITLLNMPVLAQQTGKHTIGFSQRPISYFNYETGLTETIPTHQISNFNPDDETTWDEDDHELLSEKYGGQSPQFALQTICDKQGEPIVFIVDDFIYNKNGEGFYNPNQADYFNLHGDESLFNPYVINPDYDQRVLYENIIVIPEPNSCNSFYVFYGLLDQPSSLSSIPQVYYRKLTYLDEENIELTEPEILSLDYLPACQQFSNFTMAMTEYDEIQNNNLLIIQYVGDVFVVEIDDNIGNWEAKKLSPLANERLLKPRNHDGTYRINPVLTTKANGNIVMIVPTSVGNPTGHALLYYSFSRNFDAINPLNFEFILTDYNGSNKIRGMEISPNGYQLYTTQENQTGFQVFNLQNYIQGLGNPPTNSNTIGSGNFSNSDLFLGRDNKIYCIKNLSSTTSLTTINDPNNPASTTFSSNVFALSNFQKSLIGSYYDRDAYIFPYQIDQSDYITNYPPAQYTQPDWSTIGANETWTPGIGNNPFNSETGIITFADDFEIPSGKYIQIENMEFHFADNKKAIINTGAVLRIINSKLTSADHCDQTTMWDGVLVKGNANANQSAANQGRFRMDAGSEVSNAVYAVKVESGAICQIYGGEIKNNVYGVYFNPYIHPQVPAYNAAIIQNATFETNRALNNGDPNMHIRLNGVNGIDINLCTLTNTRDNTVRADFRGQGLLTYNANFTMSNCDINGFYYGAKVYGGSTPNITDCDFSNNLRGMLMKNVLLADIKNNTFDGNYNFPIFIELIPNPYPYEYYNYSLYVAGDGISSAIHEIKGNTITNGRLGLLLYNTGESATQIRDNTFNNISGASNVSAAIVMGKNSDFIEGSYVDIGETGTEFRCNSFSQNTYDMSIVDGNMRKYQGEHNASSGEEYAGNSFDHYGTSTERDFYVDASIASSLNIPLYEYYSHVEDTNHTYDIEFYSNNVIEEGKQFDYSSNDCLEDSGGGGIVIKGKSVGESIGDIETLDSEISLKSFELSELTDNGETYIMLSEVENASTTNSTEVASDLSELDGFISDEVTLTYMQNSATGEFDKAGALLANSPLPSAAKNEIDNMGMNSTLKTIIKAGQNGKNSREIKEAEIAGLKQTRGLIVKEMVNRVMTNDSLQSERNELISFLQNDNTFTSKIHLLNLYKAKKNHAAIETCINDLRTQIHSFDVDRLTEMENYLDLQELVLNVDNGLFSMEDAVSQNMEFLQNLANTENVAGEIQAQILLEETGNSEFLEIIKLPEEIMDNKNMAIQSESENMTNDFESIVKVYPNPSSDYFSIEYALIDFSGNETIEIYSSNGRLIDRLDIPYAIGTFKFEQKLPAGNYIIKVGENYTQKLNIL